MILNFLFLKLLVYNILIIVCKHDVCQHLQRYKGSNENIDFYVKIVAQTLETLNKFKEILAMKVKIKRM
jgi:hypothetical protein